MYQNDGLTFQSETTNRGKTFKISFPIDAYLGLNWDKDELEKLHKYEASEYISDKLLMLALIGAKLELKPKEEAETDDQEDE